MSKNPSSKISLADRIAAPKRSFRVPLKLVPMEKTESSNGGKNLVINHQFVKTLFGNALIASTNKGICFFAFSDKEKTTLEEVKQRFPRAIYKKQTDPLQAKALRYLSRKPGTTTIPLHLIGTPFQLKVWEALLHIPLGSLSTYGSIAEYIHHPNAYRAVGTAVGMNPVCFLIPCHRVIQAKGNLGNYHWGTECKAKIVAWEA